MIFSALHDGSGTRSKMEREGMLFRNTAVESIHTALHICVVTAVCKSNINLKSADDSM